MIQKRLDHTGRWDVEPVSRILEQHSFDPSLLTKNGYERRARKWRNTSICCDANRSMSYSSIIESTIFRSNILRKSHKIEINDKDNTMPKYSAISIMVDALTPTIHTIDSENHGLTYHQSNVHNATRSSTTDKREQGAFIPLQKLSTALQHEIDIVDNIRFELEKVKVLERSLNVHRDEAFDASKNFKQSHERNTSFDDCEDDNYSDSSFVSE